MSTLTWTDTLTTIEPVTEDQHSKPYDGGEELHHVFCIHCDHDIAVCGTSIAYEDGWVDCDYDEDGDNCIVCEMMDYCPKCGRTLYDEEVDDEVEAPS